MSVQFGETPTIANYTSNSNAYSGLPVGNATFLSATGTAGSNTMDWIAQGDIDAAYARADEREAIARARTLFGQMSQARPKPESNQEEIPMPQARRIVEIYIADPNENVPLEDALLFTCAPKMTDLTDQELFFEIDIKSILATHNEKRVKITDRKVKDRVELLEAAKVRDLKMVVNTVAQF